MNEALRRLMCRMFHRKHHESGLFLHPDHPPDPRLRRWDNTPINCWDETCFKCGRHWCAFGELPRIAAVDDAKQLLASVVSRKRETV